MISSPCFPLPALLRKAIRFPKRHVSPTHHTWRGRQALCGLASEPWLIPIWIRQAGVSFAVCQRQSVSQVRENVILVPRRGSVIMTPAEPLPLRGCGEAEERTGRDQRHLTAPGPRSLAQSRLGGSGTSAQSHSWGFLL